MVIALATVPAALLISPSFVQWRPNTTLNLPIQAIYGAKQTTHSQQRQKTLDIEMGIPVEESPSLLEQSPGFLVSNKR